VKAAAIIQFCKADNRQCMPGFFLDVAKLRIILETPSFLMDFLQS
jgi:hypothetical protein